jgi:hypothetical protein
VKRKYIYWAAGALAVIYVANRYLGQKLPFDIYGYLTGTSAVDANQNKYTADTLGGVGAGAGTATMATSQTGPVGNL